MALDAVAAILQVQKLTWHFPQQQVFDNFSVDIPAGITYVVGGESMGKSTLLRLMASDVKAQEGELFINGIRAADDPHAYRQQVFLADSRSTVHDPLVVNAYFDMQRQFYPAFDDAVLNNMLHNLSLTEHVAKNIFMLSAGSKRKVWLAAAFASGAAVTLIDEPFAALDKVSMTSLLDRLTVHGQNPNRAFVIADYEVPQQLVVSKIINL
jgi:ABC-type multidrug transport system ATPase subunit